jgi:YHS domain-containing protein
MRGRALTYSQNEQIMKKRSNAVQKVIYSFAAVILFTISGFAGHLVNVSGASGIALDGYDPVAFFTDQKPVNGDPSISATYEGATYFFASKDHQNKFKADPTKYAPQFGGFCAFGASEGALFPVDISTWQVRNDKLYLNLNPAILQMFNKTFDERIKNAQKNWPDLVAKNSK